MTQQAGQRLGWYHGWIETVGSYTPGLLAIAALALAGAATALLLREPASSAS